MRLTKSHLSLMLAGTILSACTMAPSYERPAAPVSPSWPNETISTLPEDAQASIATIGWQDFFQSSGLRTAIQTALDNNRDLKIAALNIEAARASYNIQRADLLPSIGANGQATVQRTSDDLTMPGADNRTEIYQANVGVTAFELDVFGRVRSLNEGALQDYLATREAANAVRIALIAETANAYLQFRADQKILDLTRDTLTAQESSAGLIDKRKELGVSSALDVAQAQTALETARANLALYERRIAQSRNALTLLMGVPYGSVALPDETLDDVAFMNALPVGLPSTVLLLRPDVRQAEHTLQADNARIGAARAAFFPRISLTGAFGFASDDLGGLFSSGGANAWSFVPQITMPIFESGRNIANLDLADVRKNIAVANYERTIQSAFREVSDELDARRTLGAQLEAQTRLAAAAQSAYNVSDARYKEGIDNYLAVLDAQRSLYAAQQGKIDIERQKLVNLVNLYKALGGGTDE